ncbi:hypothetical protein C8J57DRAFT_1246034 [Mycena rebaudengoi]|nr:hypothetical protein C8J57DRAFT_1246034 [Mycena rebaudengoi]
MTGVAQHEVLMVGVVLPRAISYRANLSAEFIWTSAAPKFTSLDFIGINHASSGAWVIWKNLVATGFGVLPGPSLQPELQANFVRRVHTWRPRRPNSPPSRSKIPRNWRARERITACYERPWANARRKLSMKRRQPLFINQLRLSDDERRRRGRAATKANYDKAAKKAAKRKWDPPKKAKVLSAMQRYAQPALSLLHALSWVRSKQELDMSIFAETECSMGEVEGEEWGEEYLDSGRDQELNAPDVRDKSPTATETDEILALQALIDLANFQADSVPLLSLAPGQRQEPSSIPAPGLTTPQQPELQWSPLPPSSPNASSKGQTTPPRSRWGWVSPSEWDAGRSPESPLPPSAYERIQWPDLFRRLWTR